MNAAWFGMTEGQRLDFLWFRANLPYEEFRRIFKILRHRISSTDPIQSYLWDKPNLNYGSNRLYRAGLESTCTVCGAVVKINLDIDYKDYRIFVRNTELRATKLNLFTIESLKKYPGLFCDRVRSLM